MLNETHLVIILYMKQFHLHPFRACVIHGGLVQGYSECVILRWISAQIHR